MGEKFAFILILGLQQPINAIFNIFTILGDSKPYKKCLSTYVEFRQEDYQICHRPSQRG